MKSVLISIKPKWCELIANGQKTVEVRKTRPKLETPFKCYIYCTQTSFFLYKSKVTGKIILNALKYRNSVLRNNHYEFNGKVIGEFVCNYIEDFKEFEYGVDALHRHIKLNACIGYDEIYKYLGFEKCGYGWHISDLVIYDEPKELSEFGTVCEGLKPYQCDDCEYSYTESNESIGVYHECCCDNIKPLKRPPQSWCYVEERKMRE